MTRLTIRCDARFLIIVACITCLRAEDVSCPPSTQVDEVVGIFQYEVTASDTLQIIKLDIATWRGSDKAPADWFNAWAKPHAPRQVALVQAMAAVAEELSDPRLWTISTATTTGASAAQVATATARLERERQVVVTLAKQVGSSIDPLSEREVASNDIVLLKPMEYKIQGPAAYLNVPCVNSKAPPSNHLIKIARKDPARPAPAEFWLSDHTEAQIRAIRIFSERLVWLSQQVSSPLVDADVKVISTGYAAWSNYLQDGYSQFPWELAANSLIDSWHGPNHLSEPPNWQLVLLHPELGVSMRATREYSEVKPEVVVLVQALGFVNYPSESNNWFWGLSTTGTFNDSYGFGIGGTLLLGGKSLSSFLPPISVGIQFYDVDKDTHFDYDKPSITLGLDLAAIFFKDQIPKGLIPAGAE